MSVTEAAELARRSIYHATFRDAASGGVVSGMFISSLFPYFVSIGPSVFMLSTSLFLFLFLFF